MVKSLATAVWLPMEKPLLRRILNRVLHAAARICPGLHSCRPFLHRLRGARIYGRVSIGDDVYLENEYPECIELHDGAAINLRCTLIAHFRGTGRIVLQKNARVAACCTIVCSPGKVLTIGEGSFVAAGSVVKRDVAPYTLVAGVPAKPIARITVPLVSGVDYFAFKEGLVPIKATEETAGVLDVLCSLAGEEPELLRTESVGKDRYYRRTLGSSR
jgi:acetyltransferase-like isoleucine patch superfamily enzyme